MTADLFEKTVSPSDFTGEEWKKLKFVEERLAPMVKDATGGVVCSCRYMKSAVAPVECVAMRTVGGVAFRADVTADSLWAMAKDVMRAVARQYE